MTDSVTDSLTAQKTLPLVNGKMQRDVRYRRTETPGKAFVPDFVLEPTPKQVLAMGVFGGKQMTDC
jgi:hypothetical protein